MYLLLIGTERCCDVAGGGGGGGTVVDCVVVCARARARVCGGDGCVGDTGDTTNACTMYYDVPCDGCVVVWVSVWPAVCTCCRSIDVF